MNLFKRPAVHYGKTPEPETLYQKAAQVWDERLGSARVQARNWRYMAFGSLILSTGFASALVYQSARGTVVPWVVQVDNLGQAQTVAPATADYRPTDPQVAWHLARFIEQTRSIPADPIIVRQNWLRAYGGRPIGARLRSTIMPAPTILHEGRQAADRRRGFQRHPRFSGQLPRRVDGTAFREWPARRDRAMDCDPDHRHPASARCRAAEGQSARNLHQRRQLVAGDEPMKSAFRNPAIPVFRKSVIPVLLLSATALAGCATPQKPPEISYDRDVPALPAVPVSVTDDRPRPIHIPPAWTPAKGGTAASTPVARVENANAAARVQPRRRVLQCDPDLPLVRRSALSGLRSSRADHRYRVGTRRVADRRRADCGRRYRPLDYRRHRERQRHDPARPYPREAVTAGHHDQSRRDHGPARLHDRAAFRRETLYALRRMVLSAAARRTKPEHPGDAGHPGRRGAQLPLRFDRRQPALETRLRL